MKYKNEGVSNEPLVVKVFHEYLDEVIKIEGFEIKKRNNTIFKNTFN